MPSRQEMSTQEASPSLKVWSLQLLQSKLVLRRCHEILASSPPQNETEVLRCVHGRLQARISQLREDLNATSAESVVRNRLSHVAQIRALSVNVIVLNCSLVQLFHLERGAEQALIWSRLQQYVEPRTGASDALSTFAHDFDAANDAVEALVRDRGEAVDAPDARQWTALTAERIELLLPVRRLGASFDASDRHCSICLALYKPREDVRTFHPCDHVYVP